MSEKLKFDQTYDENRQAFIDQLMISGWSREDAESEWDRIQDDEEGNL